MANTSEVVSLSRQCYGYGVAFHLTGDLHYLRLAKAGVDFIRQNAFDRPNQTTFTRLDKDTQSWGAPLEHRNVQELAYALLGLSFYYYLTRDPDILSDILMAKRSIFSRYFNTNINALQWTLQSTPTENHLGKHLVAHLDQLNSYLVLMTPLLDEPEQSQWKKDLLVLSDILLNTFYSPGENLFVLRAKSPGDTLPESAAIDFGHTIKCMWMLRFIGLMTNRPDLVQFAETQGLKVLERAYLPSLGAWANGVLPNGGQDLKMLWWVHNELNQFTSTMSLSHRSLAPRLARTFKFYREYFVDHRHGEVWTSIDGHTLQPIPDFPKAWPWKSAFHTFEHALVGYIAAQAFHDKPVTLYFAFPGTPDPKTIRPYFFEGSLQKLSTVTDSPIFVREAVFTKIR